LTAELIVVHGGAGIWPEGVRDALAACAEAAESGMRALRSGGALDGALAAVRVLEDAPCCNAGTGAVLTADGSLELDACVMDGASLRSGAVACLPPFRHPIDVAHSVLEDGRYHMLTGDGAARFASDRGFVRVDPAEMGAAQPVHDDRSFDGEGCSRAGNTVGAVTLDSAGAMAAATSTGGIAGRHPGRVGDSPIVGAGTYADERAACSCTGEGEAFARACAAFWAVENAADPQRCAEQLVDRVRDRFRGVGGVIVVNAQGSAGIAHTMPHMPHAVLRAGERVRVGA
jgi:L-asparaginase / beta-aspartyl-peptidase